MRKNHKPLIATQIFLMIGILYSPFMFIQMKDYYGEVLHGLLFIYFAAVIYYFKCEITSEKIKNLTLTMLLNFAVPILSCCITYFIVPDQNAMHPDQYGGVASLPLILIYFIRLIVIYLSYTLSFLYLHEDLVKQLYVINDANSENNLLYFLLVNEPVGRLDFLLKANGSIFLLFLTTLLYLAFADLTDNLILLGIPYTFGLGFFVCIIRNTLARLDDLNWSRAWVFSIIFPAIFSILNILLLVTPGKNDQNYSA